MRHQQYLAGQKLTVVVMWLEWFVVTNHQEAIIGNNDIMQVSADISHLVGFSSWTCTLGQVGVNTA